MTDPVANSGTMPDPKPASQPESKSGTKPRNYAIFDAELSGNALNVHLLRRLLKWMKPYQRTLVISGILILLASTLQVMMPIIISLVVIDNIIRGGGGASDRPDLGMVDLTQWLGELLALSPLLSACLIYALLQIGWTIAGHFHRLTLTQSVVCGLRDLRLDLFKHLETRPAAFYDRVAVGRIMTRVTNDVEALYELLRGIGSLVGELVPFFVALTIMFAIDPQLTLLLLLVLPLITLATLWFRRQTRVVFRNVRQSLSSLNQNLQENLSGLTVVHLSVREAINLKRYQSINEENRRHERRSVRLETLYGAFTDSMGHLALALILWYGGKSVLAQSLTLGEVVLFTRFIDMLIHPIIVLGEQTNILFRAMASGERIFQTLDWDEKIHDPVNPTPLPRRLRGEVEFKNLSFAYHQDQPVLKNVNFRIAPGETLAIVGATGSGKSTLVRLLSRFYDFPDGRIFLDGIDLNHIHSHDLRKRIGVVLQDFHIFSGTIFDNIALGNPQIDLAMAEQAARTVNAHDFINDLPQGYQTPLSERGQNLSQGQRQLLAFARVLAANPEILVLDEATANIDTHTEELIQDALHKLTEGRTSILIAHRLQTIQEADRILAMDQGQVVEVGTHAQLLEQDGLYANLHRLQFQSEPEPA